jgi:hypothetical protein
MIKPSLRHVLHRVSLPFGRSVLCSVVLFLAVADLSNEAAALTIKAETASIKTAGGPVAGGWNLYSNGTVGEYIRVKTNGAYDVAVSARGSLLGGIGALMSLNVDGLSGQTTAVNSGPFRIYTFRVKLDSGVHSIGVSFLNDAHNEIEDRNLYIERIEVRPVSGSTEPIRSGEGEWALTAKAREEAVLRSTNDAIRKNRMGPGTITVLDGKGDPIPGVQATAELRQHDFLFGCNIFGFDRFQTDEENDLYRTRFKALFNYATIPFYWAWLDPTHRYTDRLADWCRKNGIKMKGHPLLWDTTDGIPPWSKGIPSPDAQKKHVEEVMQRYRGTIEFWEVVNEPSHLFDIPVAAPHRWAHEAAPQARLLINDYGALSDGNPVFFDFLTNAKLTAIPFDGIGIQAHEPPGTAFPLGRVQAILDLYGTLGKRIHITEFTLPSDGRKTLGAPWRKAWSEAQQADYADKFYRVCFAHPAVDAITWWDLSDRGSWLKGGGMLRTDLSPKPVYEALRKLIRKEWWTTFQGTTDEQGRLRFFGFFGFYRVTLRIHDTVETMEFHLVRGGQNVVVHAMDAHASP